MHHLEEIPATQESFAVQTIGDGDEVSSARPSCQKYRSPSRDSSENLLIPARFGG